MTGYLLTHCYSYRCVRYRVCADRSALAITPCHSRLCLHILLLYLCFDNFCLILLSLYPLGFHKLCLNAVCISFLSSFASKISSVLQSGHDMGFKAEHQSTKYRMMGHRIRTVVHI